MATNRQVTKRMGGKNKGGMPARAVPPGTGKVTPTSAPSISTGVTGVNKLNAKMPKGRS